jgi:transposase
MYRDVAQWTKVRRKVLEEGVSRRQLARETGISRPTIQKMLLHAYPQPGRPRPPRYPKLGDHIHTVDRLVKKMKENSNVSCGSIKGIFEQLKANDGYAGSYGAVKDYMRKKSYCKELPRQRGALIETLGIARELIVSLEKADAIEFIRIENDRDNRIVSPARAKKVLQKVEKPRKPGPEIRLHAAKIIGDKEWILRVQRKELTSHELRAEFGSVRGFPELIEQLYEGRFAHRNRVLPVLAHLHGISDRTIASALQINRETVASARRRYNGDGAGGLFATKKKAVTKVGDSELREAIFAILHESPSSHGLNRTSWTMPILCEVLASKGKPACGDVVRTIIRAAGYRWRKARVVLTSNDPDYAERLARIKSILSGLGPDEAFFSIDEFGPFAVKAKPGRVLTAPGEEPQVAQWQKSKGCLILTAALELSENQVIHFYSTKKNTMEMIRMMDLLLERYHDRRKLYLSWDAASWHISKRLFDRIEENNKAAVEYGGPIVEVAPLPARAQFLNVIESNFSGMARAIIHNSDYRSIDEAKAAIDRHFDERNRHSREHPRRAGNKIWGKERVPPEFAEGNNCKDPRYR